MSNKQEGFVLTWVISIMLALSIIISAALSVIYLNIGTAINNTASQSALNISEAGINYYLWHLSHNATDFKDGKTTPTTPDANLGYGPYVHDYYDDNGVKTGTYTLWIKPKGFGSTVATVRSIGQTLNGGATRTIQADIGAPSFSKYGLAANVEIWFGDGEAAKGPVHSNIGVVMDGTNDSDVTSTNATYSSGFFGGTRNGVWCRSSGSYSNSAYCASRNKTSWRYPVSNVDFAGLVADRCTLKLKAFNDYASTQSQATGANPCNNVPNTRTNAYIPRYSSTGAFNSNNGYLMELNSNTTYNLWRVSNQVYQGGSSYSHPYTNALTRTLVANNIAIPPSGVVFVEDNLWVRTNPVFNGRVTIVAARQADANNANIIIADDVEYSTQNGQDVIGLISEKDILIAPYAPPRPNDSTGYPFKFQAAAIASTGSVMLPSTFLGRNLPTWNNSNKKLDFYGSIVTNSTWTWSYTSGIGFYYNTTSYDYNLLYAPPPHFPVTSTYDILSWREVLTTP